MAGRDLRSMKHGSGIKRGINERSENPDMPHLDENVKRNIQQYDGMDRNELMGEAARMVREGKQNGTMNAGQLDSYLKMLSPMLDEEKRRELQKVISQLKNA